MERKEKIRNIVLIAVAVVGLFFAFGGGNTLQQAGLIGASPELRAYAERTLVPMDGEHYRDLLTAAKDKPVLVFVYASWCPWCKKQFPMIKALRMRFENDVHFAYVSIDDDPYALSRFLMEKQEEDDFTPYHVAKEHKAEFYGALAAYGFNPTGSVPYMVLTDKQGNRAGEFRGLTEVPVLRDAIREALKAGE